MRCGPLAIVSPPTEALTRGGRRNDGKVSNAVSPREARFDSSFDRSHRNREWESLPGQFTNNVRYSTMRQVIAEDEIRLFAQGRDETPSTSRTRFGVDNRLAKK